MITGKKSNMKEEKKNLKDSSKYKQEKKKDKDKKNKELNKLKEENKDLQERHQRALADYQNLLKNSAQEKQNLVKYSNEQLLQELIPVYDNLKMALNHVDKESKESNWVKGVEYVVKQFREVLQNNGVEEIKTEGEKFDYNSMEAVEGKGEKVKKEVKPGYKLNGKVIIPAKVILENKDK